MKIDIPTVLSVATAGVSFLFWYSNQTKKVYGFERDLKQIKENQANIQTSLSEFMQDNLERMRLIEKQLIELKAEVKFKPHD